MRDREDAHVGRPSFPRGWICLASAAVSLFLTSLSADAQTPAGRARPPAVFLDCQSGPNCDQQQFRTEITFVNWARDRKDSNVHVIFTSQGMSGGN